MSEPTSTPVILRSALEAFRGPASVPIPTDPYECQHWEMAGAHALFVHVLLSIYEQATEVPRGKEVDFAGYALVWAATLEHHHEWEETRYFEMYSHKYDLRSSISSEHDAFHGGLVAFEEYLVSCLPSGTTYGFGDKVASAHTQTAYDGEKVKGIIDTFAQPMAEHFMQEIVYLEPAKVRAAGLTEDEIQYIAQETQKKIMALPFTTFTTFVVMASPKWTTFPPVPPLFKNFLVPYVFYHANRRVRPLFRLGLSEDTGCPSVGFCMVTDNKAGVQPSYVISLEESGKP